MRHLSTLLRLAFIVVVGLVAADDNDCAKPRNRSSLDSCDSVMALTIWVDSGHVKLSWFELPDVKDWTVYRATRYDMADLTYADTVADTTVWTEYDSIVTQFPKLYYYVAANWEQGSPHNYRLIEDFENPVILTSYPVEDVTPTGWDRYPEGYYNPYGLSLDLFGNTWKQQSIDTVHLDSGSVWRIAAKVITVGEGQAFGLADSANEFWYSLWGSELRQSEGWNTTYQGWFPSGEWVLIDLPVGEDWRGRFGYYPNITTLLYANDRDVSSGRFLIDDIRDVTGTVSVPPLARFSWTITDHPSPDSFDVEFCSMGCDPEGPLYGVQWAFGDGTHGFGMRPQHRYASGNEYVVVLLVSDSLNQSTWTKQVVFDTVITTDRQFTALFGGDVMLARRYVWDGGPGIIPTQGVNAIFERIRPLVSSVDFAMCNLECPLTTYTEHHPTKLYYFKGLPEYVSGLTYAGLDYVALANNHNFDYLEPGMTETKHVLDSVGLLSGGAGINVEMARQPVFYSQNGLCVAVLSFCNRDGSFDNEQPFLAAGPLKPGFAQWDRAAIETMIPAVRDIADFIIVQVHSGEEYAAAPPTLQELGWDRRDEEIRMFELIPDTSDVSLRRYALDMGADIVINHHPHVVQGVEIHDGKLIAHSMGNFAFDQTLSETFLSMAVTMNISQSEGIGDFVVHPIYINRYIPTPATGELGGAILDYLSELSRPFNTWMVRSPDSIRAAILIDTTSSRRSSADFSDTLWLEERSGYAFSAPFRLRGSGYPTQMSVVGGDSVMFRYGRDVLLIGNVEDEGATPWDLNSNYERYDASTSYRGDRSIGLNRSGGGTNSVSTVLLQRPPYNRSREHTMSGWISASNGREVKIQFELYSGRTGDNLQTAQQIQGMYAGSFDWMNVWDVVTVPENGWFYNVRLNLRAPSSAIVEGRAWFDDLALVQWQEWQHDPVNLGFPNNLGWMQVRAPSGTAMIVVNYRRSWVNL